LAITVEIATKGMDHAEWLEMRRRGIGGSDAAAIAGLSRYRTPLQVYMEKLGLVAEPEENEAMYWGTKLEDLVAEEFSLRTGLKVRRKNAILKHPEYPWMLANVDRLIVGKLEGLECKTASAYKADEWEGDNIPWEYAIQCYHYMAVTGYVAWWIAVLIGGNKFVYKRIDRDEKIIADLIKIESDFWHNHVLKQVPPEPDGSDASTEFVKALYPESNGKSLDLPSTAAEWIEKYEQAVEDEKAAQERKQEAQNHLQMLLGEYETGFFRDWKVVWKTITSNRVDSKKLKEEQPEIYEKYLKPSVSRRFEIKRMEA